MPSVAEVAAAITRRRAEAAARAQPRDGFYLSRAWRALRYRVLAENAKRNGGAAKCELCGRGRQDGAILHCDHIEPLSRNWERRLDPANVQVFCDACNLGKSNKDATDFRPRAVNELAGETLLSAGGAAGSRKPSDPAAGGFFPNHSTKEM